MRVLHLKTRFVPRSKRSLRYRNQIR